MNSKCKYGYIDIFKFIFSICIVAILTGLLSATSQNINWYLTHMILRLAVPFFFIVSGFFYGKKIIQNKDSIDDITHKYIKNYYFHLYFG